MAEMAQGFLPQENTCRTLCYLLSAAEMESGR